MNLSIVIITKNEEANIARCLASCKALQAEILVLDSQSTDRTTEIAQEMGAKVYSISWKGYGPTKNEGAQLASHDWILSLDADEEIGFTLIGGIRDALKSNEDCIAYYLKRHLVFKNRELAFGAVRDEWRLRLYHKNYVHWNDRMVHEDLEVMDKKIEYGFGKVAGHILHHSYKNVQDMRERLERYAQLSAEQAKAQGKKVAPYKKWLNSSFSFVKNYFLLLGILDGVPGFEFALEQARYVYKKYKFAEN